MSGQVAHAAPVHTTTLAALAAAVLLPVSLTACSGEVSVGGGGYDPDDVAAKVQEAQEKATPDLDVTDATCPDDEPEKGGTIECTIAIDGVEAPYSVTFTRVDDDGVNFDVAPAKAIVSTDKAAGAITAQLEKAGYPGVEVDCGDAGVIVQDPKTTFTCDLTDTDGTTSQATVTIDDLDGNVHFEA